MGDFRRYFLAAKMPFAGKRSDHREKGKKKNRWGITTLARKVRNRLHGKIAPRTKILPTAELGDGLGRKGRGRMDGALK